MFLNKQTEYLKYKKLIEKDEELFKDMAKVLLPFFDILNESVNLNKEFDLNQIDLKFLEINCESYFPYWIYDGIQSWLLNKKEQLPFEKDKNYIDVLILLVERMIEMQKELVNKEYEKNQY